MSTGFFLSSTCRRHIIIRMMLVMLLMLLTMMVTLTLGSHPVFRSVTRRQLVESRPTRPFRTTLLSCGRSSGEIRCSATSGETLFIFSPVLCGRAERCWRTPATCPARFNTLCSLLCIYFIACTWTSWKWNKRIVAVRWRELHGFPVSFVWVLSWTPYSCPCLCLLLDFVLSARGSSVWNIYKSAVSWYA